MLAEQRGVAADFVDQAGTRHEVSEQTILATLAALGADVRVAADRQQAIDEAHAEFELRNWRRMIPPVFVTKEGDERAMWVHVRDGAPAQAYVITEDGERIDLLQVDNWTAAREVDGVLIGEASFAVPGDLPLGWHTVHAVSDDRSASAPLVMAPRRLDPEAIAGARQWGFMEQVYATRSRESWGFGDLHDAAMLASWSAAELGAGFLLVNPLHAASPVAPLENSPYLPVTRRFASPLYLHVEDIPEYAELKKGKRKRIEELAAPLRERNTTSGLLDRDSVWAAKLAALRIVHKHGLSKKRTREFSEYQRVEGQGLVDFATWCALSESVGHAQWPAEYARPDSPAVLEFRAGHAREIDFHMWMQWQLDQQLARTQAAAVDAGMRIGLMHDLAVGVHPSGSDAWSLQDVLARGVSVGAPPDMYNQMGQDWSQPPWRPDSLAEAGFIPFRDMLRTILRHAGGLRIDHVLGLFRLWWIPAGHGAKDGTFVRFDHESMLSVLCLEAYRAGAIIIGEDLGTVEPWVRDALADRGILGTVISWFERTDGEITPLEEWRTDVLASVTVHDLPPTAGYLRDEHVRIREQLHLLTGDPREEYAQAAQQRAEWADLMQRAGIPGASADTSTAAGIEEYTVALHRAVGSTKARLIGIGLPDVVGDRRAQNQPGTFREYPNWCVPMSDGAGRAVTLEQVMAGTGLTQRLVEAVRDR